MSLTIGALALTPRRPDDLDAQLVADTGCDAAEIETLLSAGPDRAARALRPFLANDAPDIGTLAAAIARDPAAIAAIRALYAAPPTETLS
jgi:hypothetical protein